MSLRRLKYETGELLEEAGFVKRMSNKQKVAAGGAMLTAGAAAFATVVGFWAFPPRTELANDWASAHGMDYTDICYTPNAETKTELSVNNEASRIYRRVSNQIEAGGPIGAYLATDLVDSDAIFCFGPRHDSGHDVHKQGLGRNLYFTADDLQEMDVELSTYLFERRGLYPYMSSALTQREDNYITSAALIWKRSTEAMKAVVHVDAMHSMLLESGLEGDAVFDHEKWISLEENPNRADAAITFRETYQASPNYYSTRLNEARNASFHAAYHSEQFQVETDVTFLRWYAGEVDEQEETRTREVAATCTDTDGNSYSCTETETYTVMVDPPYYVHSEDIHPATLVALSDIFTYDDAFLTLEDAQNLINDPRALTFHNDATRRVYDRAANNARWHAIGNFDGERTEIGRGIRVEFEVDGYEF